MRMSPIAIGMEVVPIEKPVINTGAEGARYPIAIPRIIAEKIQNVRYESRNESRFTDVMFSPVRYCIYISVFIEEMVCEGTDIDGTSILCVV